MVIMVNKKNILKKIILLSIIILISTNVSAWYSQDHYNRQQITITNPYNEDFINYPILIKLTNNNFNYNNIQNPDGNDILIVDPTDTYDLNFFIEDWNNTDNNSYIWINIPLIEKNTNTTIYMYYNSDQNTTQYENTVFNSNYKAVHTLRYDPSGSAPQELDSTTNNLDGTSAGSMTSGDLINGEIGKGLEFDGTDDRINQGHAAAMNVGDSFTIMLWGAPETSGGGIGFSKRDQTSSVFWELGLNNTDKAHFRIKANSDVTIGGASSITNQGYIMLTGMYDGINMYLYENGQQSGTSALTGNPDNSEDLEIGWRGYTGADDPWQGNIDHIYLYDTNKSPNEIAFDYNTISQQVITLQTEENQTDANFTYSETNPGGLDPENGITSLTYNFYDASTCPNCTILTWQWDQNGSNISTDQNISRTWTTQGDYNITLTITNDLSETLSYSETIQIRQYPQNVTCTNITGTKYVNEDINLTCTSDNVNDTIYYNIYSQDDTEIRYDNNTSLTYTLQNKDFYDYLDYNANACNSYNLCKQSTTQTITDIGKKINYYLTNSITGTTITNAKIDFNGLVSKYYNTTTIIPIEDLLTRANKTYNYDINITHDYYQNYIYTIDLNEETTDQNIQLEPNQITLTFSTQTDGTLSYSTGGFDFNQTTITNVQTGLPQERIYITFNNNKQEYQYDNTWETHIDENIHIITETTTEGIIRIKDLTGGFIEDATVKIYKLNTDTNKFELINQKFTDAEGKITFESIEEHILKIEVLKNTYTPEIKIVRAKDYIDTFNEITIILEKGDIVLQDGIFITTTAPNQVALNTEVKIIAIATTSYEICFTYYENDIEQEEVCSTTNTTAYDLNITSYTTEYKVEVKIDQEIINTFIWNANDEINTQEFIIETKTDETERQEQFILIFIALVFTAIIIEYFTLKGLHAFFIGSILLSITNILFLPIGIIGIIYYISEMLKTYWS